MTNPVLYRYGELVATGLSGLEASRVVLWERCGPVWTYARGDGSKEPPMSLQSVPTSVVPTRDVPTCEDCGERPREGRYRLCSGCRKKRQRGSS